MTSPTRIAANRRNAQKSTGPRSDEGKQRSRMNGLTHGFRSSEIVLPTESPEAFELHLQAWMDDWQPTTQTRQFLVERAAVASWKLLRCNRIERTRLADRIEAAEVEWDSQHVARIESAVRFLDYSPRKSLTFLATSRSGVERLAGLWTDLEAVSSRNEAPWDHNRLCELLGIEDDPIPESIRPIIEASQALGRHETAQIEPSRRIVLECCQARVVELAARVAAMPEFPQARADWAEWQGATARPEDATQHRYEARLELEVRSAIRHLMKLQETGLDLIDSEPESPNEAAPIETKADPALGSVAPIARSEVPGQGLIIKANPDPFGVSGGPAGVVEVVPMVGVPLLNR